jgi:hypothetical protein
VRSSEGAARFSVPRFAQVVDGELFELHLRFPDGTTYEPSRVARNDVRVLVYSSTHDSTRSRRFVERPYALVGQEGEFMKYEALLQSSNGLAPVRARTYVKRTLTGEQIIVNDPGDWAGTFAVYRPLLPGVDLMYQYQKELGLERLGPVDDMVLRTLFGMKSR